MSDELRKILTEAGLDPRLHGGVDGAVLLLVGQRNEARQSLVDGVKCWVCIACGRVFTEPRPESALTQHKVYPNTTPGSGTKSFKLGRRYWCGPIVEGEVIVRQT